MSLNQASYKTSSIYTRKSNDLSENILRVVEELKQGSGYGSVEIILHEGRVTQIEKREKIRLPQD
ncbi:YezD family protein [Methylotenera sp. L2L1]|uniref:YezD family protein n=1 Tax=Methylotenera sp. L2L1 TaxID=1502770 RepID=UPI000561AB5C|nr:YezD family protein [Methylotenera sp. L2L1]